MFLAGGLSLFACLFLPALLEYRTTRRDHAAGQGEVARLEEQNRRADKQQEHLRNDPAYIERLNRQEFGIETPGVEIIPIETRASSTAPAPPPPTTPAEEFAADLEQATHTNPFVSVFVLDQTRPIVMVMSGVVMLVALVLLNRARSASPE